MKTHSKIIKIPTFEDKRGFLTVVENLLPFSIKRVYWIYGSDKKDYTNKIIKVPNLGDHRICMSTVVLSLITGAKSNINHFETVKTSSPSFLNIIKSLGANYEIKKKS